MPGFNAGGSCLQGYRQLMPLLRQIPDACQWSKRLIRNPQKFVAGK
jgi:hypothetical protein